MASPFLLVARSRWPGISPQTSRIFPVRTPRSWLPGSWFLLWIHVLQGNGTATSVSASTCVCCKHDTDSSSASRGPNLKSYFWYFISSYPTTGHVT
ncbi:hypothetical protein RRG08_057737 [Elysia crispata]|uniref:Uncharacterized protein n=1 Tax=Elysia crispata TaxID=231223 RepID=A0AAE0Y9N2_9GAST|nr:hypothetical protein RRG08_057737 [Elysia crispata]